MTRLGDQAFAWRSDVTSIIIPDTVTSIGSSAFAQSGITSITIPDSVKSIEECVFYECIEYIESVKDIEEVYAKIKTGLGIEDTTAE